MGRFDTADGEVIPYSDKRPDRSEPARGPEFLLPGEDAPRRCGVDPDMPPVSDRRPRVRRGYEELKR
ncbi:hypothetical protein ACVWW6_006039 [Bradyrhizobium sp. USDA 3311]